MDRTNEERPNAQIMKTKDAFVNDDNFDPEEALKAAVDKRKLLMKRLSCDTLSTDTLNNLNILTNTDLRIGPFRA